MEGRFVALHERPALDTLFATRLLRLRVLEDLPLLLLRAPKVFVLLLELLARVARCWHRHLPRRDCIPVDVVEKRMILNIASSTGTGAQPLARVAVQQVHD